MKRFLVIAALATFTAVAHAQQPAASNTTAPANPPGAVLSTVPASGTSTTATLEQQEQADSKKSKWSFSTVWQAETASTELNYSSREDKTVNTANLIGLGYKIDKENSVGFRQYFSINHDADTKKNVSDLSYPVVTYGHTFKGIAKSDDISALFWYYIPVTTADYKTHNNGNLRMDAEINWTLTPKWSVSYYLNPRQSFIPTEEVILDAKGQPANTFAKTTLIHYGNLYYNMSDATTFYVSAGFYTQWNTRSPKFDTTKNQYITNLGASFNFFGGKLNLNPEIDYAVDMPGTSERTTIASTSTYKEDNLSYVLQAAVIF